MTELLNTAVFSLSMGENNIPSTEMDPENVVSRSILHGYFSPLSTFTSKEFGPFFAGYLADWQ